MRLVEPPIEPEVRSNTCVRALTHWQLDYFGKNSGIRAHLKCL